MADLTNQHPGERDRMFSFFIERCPVAIALLDTNMCYLLVSHKWMEDYGLIGQDIIGHSYYEFFPEIPERWKKIHKRCLDGGSESCQEDPFLRQDGKITWLKWQIDPWTRENGEVAGIFIQTEDITKWKEAELDLDMKNLMIKERVKELSALYQITELSNRTGIEITDIINECLMVIPPAYQFPDITCARICIDNNKYISPGFIETSWKQEAIIISNNVPTGTIEVFYKAEMPTEQEGPFLKEERLLINSISDILGNSIERIRADKEIRKVNRLFHFISEINSCMLKTHSSEELYREACRIAIEKGSFCMAWIGLYNEEQDQVIPFCWYGNEDGYLQKARILGTDKEAAGRGPTGRAIRSRHYQYCNDVANDPSMAPWREEALKRNYLSSISIPLVVNNKLIALYTLYTSEAFFFNESEIKLLLEVADKLAFALDKLRLNERRKKAEYQLTESENKFRSLVEQTTVGVYILQNGVFTYFNPAMEIITGFTQKELNQSDITSHLLKTGSGSIFTSQIQSKESKGTQQYTVKFLRKNETVVYLELRNSMISYEGRSATIGTVLDITDRIEEEKHIAKAVNNTQEKERRQIGMELHDNVQQILVGSLLSLDFVRMSIDKNEVVDAMVLKLEGYLREAIEELRRLSHQLAPSIDAESNLKEKIEDMVSTMKLHSGINVVVEVPHFRKKLKDDIQLALYRILQEQFSNILKYAHAKNVLIRIEKKEEQIKLLIKDDGVGFKMTKESTGIGLENIRRRANVLDGTATILSSPKKGCEVIVEIPLKYRGH